MPTVEVAIKSKLGQYGACTFTRSDGLELATARGKSIRGLLASTFFPMAASGTAAIFSRNWAQRTAWLFTMLLAPMLAIYVIATLQITRFRIAFKSADGLGFRIRNADPSTRLLPFSTRPPSSFLVEGEGSGIWAEFELPRKGEQGLTARVFGTTAVTGQCQSPIRSPAHAKQQRIDLNDQAGHKATFEKRNHHTYRLVYDRGFQHDWLLFVVVATLLLR